MDALRVDVLPHRPSDRFAARYDDESDLLLLETGISPWPHGTTLDGVLTLDLDDSRVLVHVELTWPKAHWPTGDVELPHPDRTPRSLRLPSLSTQSLTRNPEVSILRSERILVIKWEEVSAGTRFPISAGITACVGDGRLTGFAVELATFE